MIVKERSLSCLYNICGPYIFYCSCRES